MNKTSFVRRAIGAAALGAIVLGSSGFSARQTPRAHPADTAHVLQYANFNSSLWPGSFDPANVQDTQSQAIIYMIYDNLVKLNTQNAIIPDLATSWDVSADKKVYTFHLRNTGFSDGKPVTADDVIYSIERSLNPKALNGKAPSPVAPIYAGHIVGAVAFAKTGKGHLAGLKKIDAHTVQITIDSPIPFFLQTLAYTSNDIVEKGTPVGGLTTKNPMQNQVSSGPFVISRYSYKNALTLVPNKYFYDYKNIKLKEIDVPFVADDSTMYQGYESGQYAMTVVPTSRLLGARSLPDFHTGPQLAIDYITFDSTRPPFNNKNLRLAISYAINRDLINQKVLKGAQKTIYSLVPQGIPGYDANGVQYAPSYNVARAKAYLAKAKQEMGASFPKQLTIKYQSGGTGLKNEYTELQYEWKLIGLNVKVQGIAFNDWLNLVAKPTASLSYKGEPWVENAWIDDYPDAQDFTTNLLAPSSNYNIGDYNNPDFESLINQALTAPQSQRPNLYIKASRIALNDVAWVMVGQVTQNYRWKSNIKGLVVWSGANNPEPLNLDWTQVDVQ